MGGVTEIKGQELYKDATKHIRYLELLAKDYEDLPLLTLVMFLHVCRKPGISLTELEVLIGKSSSTVSRKLASLGKVHRSGTKKGFDLVYLKEDPMDRRTKVAHPTTKGEHLFKLMNERFG